MSDAAIRYGATENDWDTFSLLLDLTADLLPVVSNPNLPISPDSKMKGIGKTPSILNRDGFVAGLPSWTERTSTDFDIKRWRACGDYGICIQTRRVRGIDVDIKDAALAEKVRLFICQRYKFPIRFRNDSSKFLIAFRVEGVEIPKSVLRLDTEKGGPMIEFLGNGQQFVACGTHPGGARYEWDWQGLDDFPEITIAQYNELREELAKEFAVEQTVMAGGLRKAKVGGAAVVCDDPVASLLLKKNLVLEVGRNEELHIDCPWKDNHSCDSGVTQTTYFPAGGRGYQQGHFKCLHGGCLNKDMGAFVEALGLYDDLFEALPALKPEPGKTVALPLPAFRRGKLQKRGEDMVIAELENVLMALARPDFCEMHLRYDEFMSCLMFSTLDNPTGWRELTDGDRVTLRLTLEMKGFAAVGRELMRDALARHALTHRFDSAIEWLSKEVPTWDGVKRVEGFLRDYAGAEDTDYVAAVSRYLWTALAGRVMQPGVKADMVPILIGGQGAGKSMLVEAIAPAPEFAASLNLQTKDENLVRLMKAKLIAELAELSGLHTREIESIKAFIALTQDSWVPKYQESPTNYRRRIVFVGTTNENEFLADTTGNRRWLPVVIERVGMTGIARLKRDRLQLWAEARDMFFEMGVDWSAQKLAGEAHERHAISDPWADEIERFLDTPQTVGEGLEEGSPRSVGWVFLTDVAMGALGVELKKMKPQEVKRLGAVFRKLGWDKVQDRIDGKNTKVWKPKVVKNYEE